MKNTYVSQNRLNSDSSKELLKSFPSNFGKRKSEMPKQIDSQELSDFQYDLLVELSSLSENAKRMVQTYENNNKLRQAVL